MWQERIAVDPAILAGKPIIKGTRIAVEFLVDLMAEGWGADQIVGNYPQLTAEDLQAALHYAAESLKRERVYPLAVRGAPPAAQPSRLEQGTLAGRA